MGPIDTYNRSLDAGVKTLLASQQSDGGWGLTLESVSSIVNTVEVLTVLRAAGFDGDPVKAALKYLVSNIPRHCQPQTAFTDGVKGRGERSRFISFGLEGLVLFPSYLDAAALDTISWCLRWYEDNQVADGWPEARGDVYPSIHQSALAVAALCKLVVIARQATSSEVMARLASRAGLLAQAGVNMLLRYRRPSGYWSASLDPKSPPSYSITSLANVALGFFAHLDDSPQHTVLRRETSKWLIANYRSWKTSVEHDAQVGGTMWLHLAYAQCVRGVLVGSDEDGANLSGSWKFMNQTWSVDKRMWTEGTAPGAPVTIRAAFHTVTAFETIKPASNLLLPHRLSPSEASTPLDKHSKTSELRLVNVNGGYTIITGDGRRLPRVMMPPEAQNILRIMVHAGRPMTAAELAELTKKRPNSVTKNISEVNACFWEATNGAVRKLIQSGRTKHDNGKGYYQYQLSISLDNANVE